MRLAGDAVDSPANLDTSWEVTGFLVMQTRSPPHHCCRYCRRQGVLVQGAVLSTVPGTGLLILTEVALVVEATVKNFYVRVVEGVCCRVHLWMVLVAILWCLFPHPRRHLHPRLLLLCRDRLLRFSPAWRLKVHYDDR